LGICTLFLTTSHISTCMICAIRIFSHAFQLPSGQSPVCTVYQPFSLTFQSTSDLRRLPISGSAFQLNIQPSIDCQILQQIFQSISSLRLQPTFRSSLSIHLRLASPINLPAPPSYRPATVAACRSFSNALRSTSSLRLQPIFQLSLPASLFDLRLLANLSALPSNLTSDSHR